MSPELIWIMSRKHIKFLMILVARKLVCERQNISDTVPTSTQPLASTTRVNIIQKIVKCIAGNDNAITIINVSDNRDTSL
jgi:hypothetical protein